MKFYVDGDDLEKLKQVADGTCNLTYSCLWGNATVNKRFELTVSVREVNATPLAVRVRTAFGGLRVAIRKFFKDLIG